MIAMNSAVADRTDEPSEDHDAPDAPAAGGRANEAYLLSDEPTLELVVRARSKGSSADIEDLF